MNINYKIATIVLTGTSLIFFVLFVVAHQKSETEYNPYPYIDIARNYIDQEDFIVNLQPLRDKLKTMYPKYGDNRISVYIEFVNTGANISYNQEARYFPASLIKTPVAVAAVKKIEEGEWNWDTSLIIFAEDQDLDYGNLGMKPPGTKITINELLGELLTNSDNTAFKILRRNLGEEPIKRFLISTGLEELFDNNRNITGKEYTRLIRSLYTASYLTRANSQKILLLLSESKRNYLAQAIPEDIIFSHKFGENLQEYMYADSGIVYLPNRPYIITVLFQGTGQEKLEDVSEMFKDISEETYKFFSTYSNN